MNRLITGGPPGATRVVRRIPGVYYCAPSGSRLASGETRNFEEVRVGVGRARYGGNHVAGDQPRRVHTRGPRKGDLRGRRHSPDFSSTSARPWRRSKAIASVV